MTLLNPRFELLHLVYNKGESGGLEQRKEKEKQWRTNGKVVNHRKGGDFKALLGE